MRAVLLAALLSLAAAHGLTGQERPDTTRAARPDTTLQKLRNRTPLFPEDIDPYTPLGLGRPALTLEREDLKGWPAVTLAELLPWVYPLAVDDQGGPGFFQDLHFPSGPASTIRILIDGRPLESPLGLAADLRTIPLLALERIEIRPGTSALPGGAEAGSINLVTRTHLTPQANSALLFDLGSFGREGFGGSLSRWLGSRLSVFGSLLFDDAETFTQVASAERSQFWAKARFYFSRSQFVEAAYGSSGATNDSRRTTPAGPSPFTGREDRRERRFQALYRGRAGPVLASARFYTDRFEEREAFTLEDIPLVVGDFKRRGARGSARFGVARGTMEAGVEWQEEDFESPAPLFALEEPPPDGGPAPRLAPLSRAALFAGVEQVFDSLSLAAHVRIERFDTGSGRETEPMLVAEARFGAPHGLEPYARVGRSARLPGFAERAVLVRAGLPDAVRLSGARELRAGAAWRRGETSAEISAFERRGGDASVWLPPTGWRAATGDETARIGSGPFRDFLPGEFGELNLLDVRARGVDLRFATPLRFGVRGEALALFQSVEDASGASIPYLADAYALGRLSYENRFFPSRNLRVRAALDGRVTGPRGTASGQELPAYALLDGLLRVQLIGFTVGVSAQNLLDVRYRTEEEFFLPGRVVGFEVFWEFWN